MRIATVTVALVLAGAARAGAQAADTTLGGVIDSVASYLVDSPRWTEYRRQKEGDQLKERFVGGTIALTVTVDPRMLVFDKVNNRSLLRIRDTAYSCAGNTIGDRQLRSQIDAMRSQFVDARTRRPVSAPPVEFEEFAAGDFLLRVYNKKFFRSLGRSQPVLNLLTTDGRPGGTLSLSLTVTSPSDRWMMEVVGVKSAYVLGRLRKLGWSQRGGTRASLDLEVEEVSSDFR
jgi:hypothetical protein